MLRACALVLAVAGLAAANAPSAVAQQRAQRGGAQGAAQSGEAPRPDRAAAQRQLPADVTTDQSVELPGRTLRFKATAGSIPLNNGEDGSLLAEIGYIAYVVDGDAHRPVTFVFNGGPGAASAYLDLGAIGPWRLPLDHVSVSTPPALVSNGESWLDFTGSRLHRSAGHRLLRARNRRESGDEASRQFCQVGRR